MKMTRNARILRSYRATQPDPLRGRAGDLLITGKRDVEWPGWVWCTNASDQSSWVHESLLDFTPHGARLRRDYEATELSVSEGEIVTVHEELGGWLWCTNARGDRGWVPSTHVEVQGS